MTELSEIASLKPDKVEPTKTPDSNVIYLKGIRNKMNSVIPEAIKLEINADQLSTSELINLYKQEFLPKLDFYQSALARIAETHALILSNPLFNHEKFSVYLVKKSKLTAEETALYEQYENILGDWHTWWKGFFQDVDTWSHRFYAASSSDINSESYIATHKYISVLKSKFLSAITYRISPSNTLAFIDFIKENKSIS